MLSGLVQILRPGNVSIHSFIQQIFMESLPILAHVVGTENLALKQNHCPCGISSSLLGRETIDK